VQKQIKTIRTGLNMQPGTILIPFSAQTKQGREEIWALIDELTQPEEAQECAVKEQ
jgi:GTP-binding protein